MRKQAAPRRQDNATGIQELYVAMELSRKTWKLAISDGKVGRPRIVSIEARNLKALKMDLVKARQRLGVSESARIRSCYEAGREGFWLHRALTEMGIESLVVDSASIEVNRRKKQAKTDRMDAEKLVRQLIRHCQGEDRVWSVVRVPSPEAEQERQLHRELGTLQHERNAHRMRIQSLLFTQGIDTKVTSQFLKQLPSLRCWNGEPVGESLRLRLEREYQRLQLVDAMIRQLKHQQKQMVQHPRSAALRQVQRLQQLCGIGMRSSWIFAMEFLSWRRFKNRRELAGALGLVPMPYQSGDSHHEQGISRAGNRRVRALSVEIAWCWLRLQPGSRLSQWYRKRFSKAGPRARKIGIVAMARRLMIDLWRYLEEGRVPEGARLKQVMA